MIPVMSATASAHMLGEGGGLEGAARRGRERIRKREEAARATAQNDTMSETTLAPQTTEGEGEKASGKSNEAGNEEGTEPKKTTLESFEEKEGSVKENEDNNDVKKHKKSGFRKWVRKHIS